MSYIGNYQDGVQSGNAAGQTTALNVVAADAAAGYVAAGGGHTAADIGLQAGQSAQAIANQVGPISRPDLLATINNGPFVAFTSTVGLTQGSVLCTNTGYINATSMTSPNVSGCMFLNVFMPQTMTGFTALTLANTLGSVPSYKAWGMVSNLPALPNLHTLYANNAISGIRQQYSPTTLQSMGVTSTGLTTFTIAYTNLQDVVDGASILFRFAVSDTTVATCTMTDCALTRAGVQHLLHQYLLNMAGTVGVTAGAINICNVAGAGNIWPLGNMMPCGALQDPTSAVALLHTMVTAYGGGFSYNCNSGLYYGSDFSTAFTAVLDDGSGNTGTVLTGTTALWAGASVFYSWQLTATTGSLMYTALEASALCGTMTGKEVASAAYGSSFADAHGNTWTCIAGQ